MKESLYHEVLKRARTDLADAIMKRNHLRAMMETTETEIAQLQRLIGGIHAYVDESEVSHDLLEPGEGLKGAVVTALRAANQDVTISDILAILKELQFPIESHQNPHGSIYTTVSRLVADQEVFPGEPRDGKKTYRWTRIATPSPANARHSMVMSLGKALKKR
jgi:hypothetical protein